MQHSSILNEIMGTNLTPEKMLESFLFVERRTLEKLIEDFELTTPEQIDIIRSLFRFRKTYEYYILLWETGQGKMRANAREDAEMILTQAKINLNRDSRSCFSKENFFGKIRFMLLACKELEVSVRSRATYVRWVCNFPITPTRTAQELFDHELYTGNIPHVYMHMASGFIRRRLVDKETPRQICGHYRTFLRELNISRAHARWFNTRYAGSYGSRQ